jgi:formylglycine-generating enzyme required for sulfatase activity
MGSSRREQGRRSNETLRKVKFLRPFYMGVNEVTNKEFKAFLDGHNSGSFKQESLNRNDQPVVQITWEQAALFCNWLSAKEKLPPAYVKKGDKIVAVEPLTIGYRLPTEAEWEYCARRSTAQKFLKYSWGNTFPPPAQSGNFADASAKGLLNSYMRTYNDGYPVTAPPSKFKANRWGLYDFGGNVSEWCHDYYSIYPYHANKVYIDPSGPADGKHHVVKGSSWKDAGISALRLAHRDYNNAKRNDLGFRICRYAE